MAGEGVQFRALGEHGREGEAVLFSEVVGVGGSGELGAEGGRMVMGCGVVCIGRMEALTAP